MAIFEGSIQEFHHYLGPRIRNTINLFARKERIARNGVCEDCGKIGQTLDSAHIHGRGRRTIIEEVLSAHRANGIVRCDIRAIEKQILDEHGDIADTFKFLCKDCHVRYDNNQTKEIKHLNTVASSPINGRDEGRVDVTFIPKNEALFKVLLIANQRAYVTLHRIDGSVDPPKEWIAGRFGEQSNLRGNIFSGYLRDWKQKGITKAVFAISRSDL